MSGSEYDNPYHQPVLLHEAIEALNVQPDGIYVDATFGGGGHSRAILEKLGSAGKLIAFDQDEDAGKNKINDERLIFIAENFRYLKRFLKFYKAIPVNGVLADLGVSSHQFDTINRGFSIRQPEKAETDVLLDMRMDRRQKLTAADILQQYDEAALQQIFEQYGELPKARTLAEQIVQMRSSFPMKTVGELKAVVRNVSKGNPKRYLAQVFQALRIAVNDELNALRELLEQSNEVLQTGGRLVVITFHSLEDRITKDFMKNNQQIKLIYKKPITPSEEEVRKNPRARSAKLRAADKR